MNKLTTALTAAAIIAAPLALAAPAQAGADKIDICHATSAANGGYVLINVDKSSIAKPNGHGLHEADIIPAFSHVEDRTRHHYAGLNLDKVGLIANGCKAPAQELPAAPNAPTYVPASCGRPHLPYGEVIIPKDLGEGVAGASSAMSPDAATWSVTYALQTPTEERVYSWPAGVTGNWEFTVVPLTADPNYITDAATGVAQCELPATGAGDLLLPAGAGLGILALGAVAMRLARRKGGQA